MIPYNLFRFKVWDYFSDFNPTMGPKFTFKMYMWNPYSLASAKQSFKFSVNFSPKNCELVF